MPNVWWTVKLLISYKESRSKWSYCLRIQWSKFLCKEYILVGILLILLFHHTWVKCCFRSFDRGLQYAKNGIHYADPASVRRALEYPCSFKFLLSALIMWLLFPLIRSHAIDKMLLTINSTWRPLTQHGVTEGEVLISTFWVPFLKKRQCH